MLIQQMQLPELQRYIPELREFYEKFLKDLPIINEELNKLNQVELDLPLITIKLSELDNLELSPIDIEKISVIMEE